MLSDTEDRLLDSDQVEVSPNPFQDVINVNSRQLDFDQVSVFNTQGQKVYGVDQYDYHDSSLDLSALPDGTYILMLQKGRRFLTKRILKTATEH